mgnify:CR=1 FL=1
MAKPEFKLLTDFEHIKMRPGMYIGSVSLESYDRFVFGQMTTISYVPGLVKIIEEIIDNSVDEAIRTKFENGCDISVTIDSKSVTVSDNGNGIPSDYVTTPEGDSIPQAVAAWTRTKAGSNFINDGEQIGMNGVGSSLTNAFSSKFIGESCDGKNKVTVKCSNGAETLEWDIVKTRAKGTIVSFEPAFEHFGCSEITQEVQDLIKDRLIGLSMVFPKLNFTFNGERLKYTFRQYVKLYTPTEDIPVVIQENQSCSIGLTTSDDGFRCVSYVNGLNTKNGGSHVDFVMDEIATLMIPIIKRRHKVDVTKARIKECLTLILVVKNLKGMKFDSQTKERLTNTWGEVKNHIKVDFEKLCNAIMAKEELYMPIIEAAVAKQMAAEKAALTRAQNQAKKAKIAKHIKANKCGDPKADTTLFLLEGNSAAGFLLMTRDQDLHGGLPLRGKVRNTWNETPGTIIKNKELFDILSITGLRFGEDPFEYYEDSKDWYKVTIDGKEMIVNGNDEIFVDNKWIEVKNLK